MLRLNNEEEEITAVPPQAGESGIVHIDAPENWSDWVIDDGSRAEQVGKLVKGSYSVIVLTGEEALGEHRGCFVPFVSGDERLLVPLGSLMEGSVLGIAGSSDFSDWELVRNFVEVLPFGVSVVTLHKRGVCREAELACQDFRLGCDVMAHSFIDDGEAALAIAGIKMVVECSDVVVFWDGLSQGTKNVAQYAIGENKLRLILPPRHEWQEFITERPIMKELGLWMDDDNLPTPPSASAEDKE